MNRASKSKAAIAAVIAVLTLGAVVLLPKKQDATAATSVDLSSAPGTKETTTDTVSTNTAAATSPAQQASPYKDGTYTATGSYDSPAGTEGIQVTLTLQDGIIESSNVVSEAQDGRSASYQERFISGYQQYVTGKSIDDVVLSRVSGSSLTPEGWNDAVAKIKAEATA